MTSTALSILLILLLLVGSALSPVMRGPLPPVLRTVWFELHVILSFAAYALFAVGAVLGVDFLRSPDAGTDRDQAPARRRSRTETGRWTRSS